MHECNHEHCNHDDEHIESHHEHCRHGEGHHCHGEHHGAGHCHEGGHSHHHKDHHCGGGCHGHGGKREGAGRKCENPKIPFNRRLSEEAINKLKSYASENGITETEALELAIKNL